MTWKDPAGPTPKDIALGFGWQCPYCRQFMDEGQITGVYWNRVPVCAGCAPIIQAARRAAGAQA